jgi:hypothetical protein
VAGNLKNHVPTTVLPVMTLFCLSRNMQSSSPLFSSHLPWLEGSVLVLGVEDEGTPLEVAAVKLGCEAS